MLEFGDWLFDPETRRLIKGQREERLSLKATGVLLALAETPRQVWSRDALLERVWPGVTVGEEVLTHAIAELRRAFGDDFRSPRYLETVHKSGYRLLCAGAPFVNTQSDEPLGLFGLKTYADYLGACELYDRGGRENMLASIAVFSSVIDAAPEFALGHAGLAKALTFSGTYYSPRSGELERALEHCAIAHRIEPTSAEAFAAQGLIFAIGRDFHRSAKSFQSSIQLKPDSAETHYLLGRACLAELEFEAAGTMFERAAALRADDYHSLLMSGKVWQKLGAEKRAKKNYALAHARLTARTQAIADDFRALCGLARCLWQLDRKDEATTLMERIAAHPDPMNYHLACTFARAEQASRALDVLEEVIELGWRHPAWLERDPDFDELRETPRFKRLARSIA